MIEDEFAEGRTEACASEHLAEQTCAALMDEYVRHLRSVGIAQLKRKAASARPQATRRERSSALPVHVHSRMASVAPEELRKLDERIERDCDIVRRHLFGQGEESGSEEELGLTRERIRQITRRAARVIGDLAANNPRFTVEQQAGASTVLPYARQLNLDAANVRVTEPEFVQPAPGADIEVFDTVPVGIILTRDNLARH